MHSLGIVVVADSSPRTLEKDIEKMVHRWGPGIEAGGERRFGYWSLGGRWAGQFMAKDEAVGSSQLVRYRPGRSEDEIHYEADRWDAGPAGALDLGKMQDASEESTRKRWDAWEELTAGLPVPQDSEFFRAKAKASGGTYSFDQALSDYYDQPAIVAARRSTHFLWEGGNLPREFTVEREVALSRARVRATNAAVLVTRRGRWSTPEDLRGAGQLSDQEKELSFAKVVHSYLERLRPDDMVAFVDFRN